MKTRFPRNLLNNLNHRWLQLAAVFSLSAIPLPTHALTCGALPQYICQNANSDQGIQNLIDFIANWLTGIIGLVVVLIIIISGVQMISSAGNAEAVKSARGRMTNAIIGLLLLIFFRVIVNFIIPGANL